jgi:hypothetical protein
MSTPTKKDTNLGAILETVEELRAKRFPQLDAGLVRSLLQLHADPGVSGSDFVRQVEQLVEGSVSQ